MNIKHFDCGYPYIIVDDVYDNDELDLVWREIDFLMDGDKLDYPEKTGTAYINNTPTKKNKGVFLHNIYPDNKYSNIFQCNKKIYDNLVDIMSETRSWFFASILSNLVVLDHNSTLLSYYDSDDYYKPHFDSSRISMCIWLYKEPKSFDGGDFILNAKVHTSNLTNDLYPSQTIEVKNNRMIIFPGIIPHGVTPIKIKKEGKSMGRFTITNFLSTRI